MWSNEVVNSFTTEKGNNLGKKKSTTEKRQGLWDLMSSTILGAVKTTKKTGREFFIFEGNELPINVLSFWQWSTSQLLGNALRGVLAEFIVASAIGVLELNPVKVKYDKLREAINEN